MDTAIKKAIRLSIKGGWKGHAQDDPVDIDMVLHELGKGVFLDPLFWQALGKAEGWDMDDRSIWSSRSGGKMGHLDGQLYRFNSPRWHLHRFIDHLIEGKDINSFFEKLLTPA